MTEWHKVSEVSEILPGQCKTIVAADRKVTVFNVGGRFHALDDACPHFGGPLGLGQFAEGQITCPWHGWTFSVTTGENVHAPSLRVQAFAVKIEGTAVLVELPPADPPPGEA